MKYKKTITLKECVTNERINRVKYLKDTLLREGISVITDVLCVCKGRLFTS